MLRHYFVVALRASIRHKLYSFINIAGLAVGLACAIFISLYVLDELSYDRWIPDSSNVYRVALTIRMPSSTPLPMAQAPFPVPRAMREQIPEVKAMTRVVLERMTVILGDRRFSETTTVVDPNFFQVIKLPFEEGDGSKALVEPESVVISQSLARKYFGTDDAIGKTISLSGANGWSCDPKDEACLAAVHPLVVTGILRDLPHNTQFVADIILPNTSQADEIPQESKEEWTSTSGSYGYVVLESGADRSDVLSKLARILDRSVNVNMADINLRGSEFESFKLVQLWDVHLTSDNYGGMRPPGSRAAVLGFAITALLIVLLACFNFMNLATARATLRAREIALRKIVGATRRQLITQLLGEAVLTALAALAVALAVVEILTPVYDGFIHRSIVFSYLVDWRLLVTLFFVACGAGVLSGIYPALVLSAFRPASALKINSTAQTGSGRIRTVLVVLQFAVSIGLGIGAMAVFSQINFARHIDLGFQREGVVVLRGLKKLTPSSRESFTHALSKNADIVSVALSNAVPFDLFSASNDPVRIHGDPKTFIAHIICISPGFPTLYDMRLLGGRLLSDARGEDTSGNNVLINQEAMKQFGYTGANAIGKTIDYGGDPLSIVGIISNAKIDGIRETVQPTIYRIEPARYSLLSIRLRGPNIGDTLSYIDRTWQMFVPNSAIQRYFLNDAFYNLFESDEKQGEMFGVFVAVAIFIACLGLFGLAVFTAERRTKEIGIRKIFGARRRDIVVRLLWQISLPVLVANLVAWPIAYYLLEHWLEGFAYRIVLQPGYFFSAGAIALMIAWVTVLAHALRLSRANPIHALRYE